MFGEELLVIFLEFVLEIVLNVVAYFPWELFISQEERKRPADQNRNWAAAWIVALILGGFMGGLTLLFFPMAMLGNAAARTMNLLVAPIVCALLSRLLARRRARRSEHVNSRLRFWFAWAFSTAFLLTRFIWATRPL